MDDKWKENRIEEALWKLMGQTGASESTSSKSTFFSSSSSWGDNFTPRAIYEALDGAVSFIELKRRFFTSSMVIGYLCHRVSHQFWQTWQPIHLLSPNLNEQRVDQSNEFALLQDQLFDGGMHLFDLLAPRKNAITMLWRSWPINPSWWPILGSYGLKIAHQLQDALGIPIIIGGAAIGAWGSCVPTFIAVDPTNHAISFANHFSFKQSSS